MRALTGRSGPVIAALALRDAEKGPSPQFRTREFFWVVGVQEADLESGAGGGQLLDQLMVVADQDNLVRPAAAVFGQVHRPSGHLVQETARVGVGGGVEDAEGDAGDAGHRPVARVGDPYVDGVAGCMGA
ncbi:hypothetical protein [Streptomyces sp. NPDC059761]|uniref:hypothetical protein n=1 Tax=Streptomyces sp. NPDC059761 TaxID=3346937 RepID=UPI003659A4F5